MLCVVGQILVEVGKAVGVGRQLLVRGPELVPNVSSPEKFQINDVQRRDVVGFAPKVGLPESFPPELVSERALPRGAHRGVAVWRTFKVHVPKFSKITSEHLVGVNVDDLLHAEGEENVEKEDFVPPDNPLEGPEEKEDEQRILVLKALLMTTDCTQSSHILLTYLLLALSSEPFGPLVGYELHFAPNSLGHGLS